MAPRRGDGLVPRYSPCPRRAGSFQEGMGGGSGRGGSQTLLGPWQRLSPPVACGVFVFLALVEGGEAAPSILADVQLGNNRCGARRQRQAPPHHPKAQEEPKSLPSVIPKTLTSCVHETALRCTSKRMCSLRLGAVAPGYVTTFRNVTPGRDATLGPDPRPQRNPRPNPRPRRDPWPHRDLPYQTPDATCPTEP
ncbi:unnamed protein product [Lampetra fluviatilis]